MTINRTDWSRQFAFCWLCGRSAGWHNVEPVTLQTHELVGNSRRAKALTIPAAWFRCCQFCHPQLSSSPTPELLAKLLALKLRYDPENYDLEAVNKLLSPNRRGGWSDGPVTQSDVDAMTRVIFGGSERC
jgi:hypothetical protein